jgi:hypothetical protein
LMAMTANTMTRIETPRTWIIFIFFAARKPRGLQPREGIAALSQNILQQKKEMHQIDKKHL